jgi:hypothetical protein
MGRNRGRLGRRSKVILAVLAAAALVVGLVVFKPWLLFIDVRVDEQLPFVASQTMPPQALFGSLNSLTAKGC